jgi:hypothetical protein
VMLHMPEPVNSEGGGIEQGRGVCVCVGGGGYARQAVVHGVCHTVCVLGGGGGHVSQQMRPSVIQGSRVTCSRRDPTPQADDLVMLHMLGPGVRGSSG